MRILVTRALADARRTAARLEAFGVGAVLAPVIRIEPRAVSLPPEPVDALLATSRHAFGSDALTSLHRRPLYAVGQATAEAARAAEFKDVRVSLGDAAALATLVRLTLPLGSCLLYLAGHDRKPTLESVLAGAGYRLSTVEAYAAVAEDAWPDLVLDALRDSEVGAALHFSRRSAALTLDLARCHGLFDRVLALTHLCLSEDAAAPLREAGAERIRVAAEPTEPALLACLADREP